MGIYLCQTKRQFLGCFLVIKIYVEGLWSYWFQHTLQLHLDPILEQDQGSTDHCTSLASTRDTKIVSH